MKKEQDLNLVNEITFILNKMGIPVDNNRLLEHKLLLSEGVLPTRSEAMKTLFDYVGVTVRSTEDEFARIDAALSRNPISLRLPKVGGSVNDVEILIVRNIDELMSAAGRAETTFVGKTNPLRELLNNSKIKTNIGKILISSDINKTIDDFIKTTNTITIPVISSKKKAFTSVVATIKGSVEKMLGDFNTNMKIDTLENDVSGTLYTTLTNLDAKLKVLVTQKTIVADTCKTLRQSITKGGFTADEITTLNGLIDDLEAKSNKLISDAETNIGNAKTTAETITKGQGAESKEEINAAAWDKNDETGSVSSWAEASQRAVIEAAEIPGRLDQKALELLNWCWNSTLGAVIKKSHPNFTPKWIKQYSDRMRDIRKITIDTVESIKSRGIQNYNYAKKNGMKVWAGDVTEYWLDSLNIFTKNDPDIIGVKNTYEQTSEITANIYKRMLSMSEEYATSVKGKNKVMTEALKLEYQTKMGYLLRDLQNAFKNTTKKRTYTTETGKEIQSLEELAIKFEELVDNMAKDNMDGSVELQTWYKWVTEEKGKITALATVGKILDERAQKPTDVWKDLIAFATAYAPKVNKSAIKLADENISKVEGEMNNKVSGNKGQLKEIMVELSKQGFNHIREVAKNLLVYNHFTGTMTIEKIFILHGPIRGALTLALRESITHFVINQLWNTITYGLMGLEGMISSVNSPTQKHPGTLMMIGMALDIGSNGNESYTLFGEELSNKLNETYWETIEDNLYGSWINFKKNVALPLFIKNSAAMTVLLTNIGWTKEERDNWLNLEWSSFNSNIGLVIENFYGFYRDYANKPKISVAELEKAKNRKDIDEMLDTMVADGGQLYRDVTHSPVAEKAKENMRDTIKKALSAFDANRLDGGFPKYLNDTYITKNGEQQLLKDALFEMLSYEDEPQGVYTFKDGEKWNFDSKYHKEVKAKIDKDHFIKWFNEQENKIGIQDNNLFYTIYPRGHFNEDTINQFIQKGSPANIGNQYVLVKDPKDGTYHRFSELETIIPKVDLIRIINTDNDKRRSEIVKNKYTKEKERIEKNEGDTYIKLLKNKEVLDEKIAEYTTKGWNLSGNPQYTSFQVAWIHRYGSKGKQVSVPKGTPPKVYVDYDTLIKKAKIDYYKKTNENEKRLTNGYDDMMVEKPEPPTVKEENKSLSYSNIINEYLSLNNIHQPKMRNLKSKLIESKRFDQDDYKHWKDTFTFQAVDEKNPGKYKDVKLNMDDVMDRIPHYRKKYDEDDSFVRAVVDTHENVVRLMFTKDLANIREGYTPTGFAMILQQIREGRGEMEIWSVARPASGNWFLVKGDFTPKELTGMDLEKNEPADKEPKKRENSLETLKKKELTSAQGLKNDERSGFNELPKILKQKLKEKFNNGWTTEEPPKKLQPYYTNSEISSVFGDNIKIYKLNASEGFFNLMSSSSEGLPIKRGFCRSIQLSKNNENLTDEHMVTIKHILNVCKNKFNGMLGISNIQ